MTKWLKQLWTKPVKQLYGVYLLMCVGGILISVLQFHSKLNVLGHGGAWGILAFLFMAFDAQRFLEFLQNRRIRLLPYRTSQIYGINVVLSLFNLLMIFVVNYLVVQILDHLIFHTNSQIKLTSQIATATLGLYGLYLIFVFFVLFVRSLLEGLPLNNRLKRFLFPVLSFLLVFGGMSLLGYYSDNGMPSFLQTQMGQLILAIGFIVVAVTGSIYLTKRYLEGGTEVW